MGRIHVKNGGNLGRQKIDGKAWSDSRSENAPCIAVLTAVGTESSVSPKWRQTCSHWYSFLCHRFPSQVFVLFYSLQANNSYSSLLSLLPFVGAVWPRRSLCQPGF